MYVMNAISMNNRGIFAAGSCLDYDWDKNQIVMRITRDEMAQNRKVIK